MSDKKSAHTFKCRESLWAKFEQMAKELECSADYLINDAMKQYARQRGYGSGGRTTGAHSAPATADSPTVAPAPRGRTPAAPPGGPPPAAPPAAGPPRAVPGGSGGPTARPPGLPPRNAPPPAVGRPPGPPPPVLAGRNANPMAVTTQMPARPPMMPAAPPRPGTRGPVGPPPLAGGPPPLGAKAPPPGPAGQRRPMFVYYMGQRHSVDKDRFIIGRGKQTSDLVIRDPNVSRQHAMVEYLNGQYYIVDMGSTNGIEYSGQRIQRRAVQDGDHYRVCDHELRFAFQ